MHPETHLRDHLDSAGDGTFEIYQEEARPPRVVTVGPVLISMVGVSDSDPVTPERARLIAAELSAHRGPGRDEINPAMA